MRIVFSIASFVFAGILLANHLDGQETTGTKVAATTSPQTAVSDWKGDVPLTTGWRSARRGMTMEELLRAMPGDAVPDKDRQYDKFGTVPDGIVHQWAKLRKKVKLDGVDYEILFRFDSSGRFDGLEFFSNQVKKETFEAVVKVFTGLFGEPTGKANKVYPSGDTIDSLSWTKEDTFLYVISATKQMTAFVTGRLVDVKVNYKQTGPASK
jgi:hypothetical protein